MSFDCDGYEYEQFLDSLASGKELVLFGASSCALKTIRDEKIDNIKYFVDNDREKYDKNGEDGYLLGVKIYPPQKLLSDKGRIVILITMDFHETNEPNYKCQKYHIFVNYYAILFLNIYLNITYYPMFY
jgi:hypothetical protein